MLSNDASNKTMIELMIDSVYDFWGVRDWKSASEYLFPKKSESLPISYDAFDIVNFRGVKSVRLNLARDGLILLVGLNESGKTTILKAIESFDFRNDPQSSKAASNQFFTDMRNKSEDNFTGNVEIIATLKIDRDLDLLSEMKRAKKISNKEHSVIESEMKSLIDYINKKRKFSISRTLPFQKGAPSRVYYQFVNVPAKLKLIAGGEVGRMLAHRIVAQCPYIVYFEDFRDMAPEKIYANEKNGAFNPLWREIIDGLFYDTDENYSIKRLEYLYNPRNLSRHSDAARILDRVNKNLNKKFTHQWQKLSGVKSIESMNLSYDSKGRFFTIQVVDRNSSHYTVSERSKGAVWYIGFLMKTEFRRKKLRSDVGRSVYLIDEPASNLHSSAQQALLTDFRSLVHDTSVIYTTHSQYLVSLENLHQVHVVQQTKGSDVHCTRWGDFIKKSEQRTTHYQPLANCLDIKPHGLDLGWKRALIVEGPSDASIVVGMYSIIHDQKPDFVVYPAGSATNMGVLISLNLGWGSSFKILLDSDKEGEQSKENYEKKFSLPRSNFVCLPDGEEIEDLFTREDVKSLWELVMKDQSGDAPALKKQIARIFGAIAQDNSLLSRSEEKTQSKSQGQLFDVV